MKVVCVSDRKHGVKLNAFDDKNEDKASIPICLEKVSRIECLRCGVHLFTIGGCIFENNILLEGEYTQRIVCPVCGNEMELLIADIEENEKEIEEND